MQSRSWGTLILANLLVTVSCFNPAVFGRFGLRLVQRQCFLRPCSVVSSVRTRARCPIQMAADRVLECSEENVLRVLELVRENDPDMFGRSPRAQNIGITGDVGLCSLDGPFVVLSLEGRFWHKRETVMTRVTNTLLNYIPELAGVDIEDEEMLLDILEEQDRATGEVISRVDRRAPDFNGDRATMEYNGVNPDDRGPFGQTLFG